MEITKELLENLYLKEKKTLREIQIFLKCSKRTPQRLLKQFNIQERKRGELIRGRKSYNNTHIIVNCSICNKEFLKREKHIKQTKRHSCSKQCLLEVRKLSGKDRCGENNPKFVDKIKVECKECNKEIFRTKNQLKRGNNTFCSQKCWGLYYSGKNNPNWVENKTINSFYGFRWIALKRDVRKRDSVCLMCNCERSINNKNLQVHHYIPFRLFGKKNSEQSNKLSNLGLYCSSCHAKLEKINVLIWTKEFFDKSKILETSKEIKDKNFHCYSVYK